MVLIKRGLDTKSHVRVLKDEDVNIDEDKAKKALSDIKDINKTSKPDEISEITKTDK